MFFGLCILFINIFSNVINCVDGKSVTVTEGSDGIYSETSIFSDVTVPSSRFQNTTSSDYSFATEPSSESELFDANHKRRLMLQKYNITLGEDEEYEEVNVNSTIRQAFAKQIGLPNRPFGMFVSRVPCTCQTGVCGCCTGLLLSAFRTKGCMNITYIPEDFAFEVKMMMNDAVLYKSKMSGKNPRPICVNPPRFDFIEVCASFHDIYFVGRNIHVCLEMDANFEGYELFNREFNCMRLGDQGFKIIRPGEDDGLDHHRPSAGTDAEIDAGEDDIEDYDENLLRHNS